ncbi:inositol monophosphatase [Streptomyces sp. NPDC026672]|uniref:inositol monophosphatase family protein n=1 Tax=unclassified Streptomyces TaxID=2593676 RepID=UPI003408AD01
MDIERIDELLSSVAAEEVMPRFGRLSTAEITRKSSAFDIVTAADRAVEDAVSSAVGKLWPGTVVVGEEAADRDPASARQLLGAESVLVLDPLDGTKNFASGLPLFAVMAAVMKHGRIVGGVIHDPVTRTSAVAEEGGGAWLKRDGHEARRLHVAAPVPLNEMEAIAGTRFVKEPLRSVLSANLFRIAGHTWFRCAGHEYRLAAEGHVHLLCYNRLMPWDHAPGWLLHKEAGGHSAHFDGSAYAPARMSGGLLYAPDEESWHVARDALLVDAGRPAWQPE